MPRLQRLIRTTLRSYYPPHPDVEKVRKRVNLRLHFSTHTDDDV
jgi:hypothetical protein